MGLFSTTTKNKVDMTTNPTIPDWINGPVSNQFGRVEGMMQGDPTQYVAPAAGSQTMADQRAQTLGSPELFSEAGAGLRDLINGGGASASSGTSADKIGLFMNPYQDQVMSRGLDAINRQGDRSMEGVRMAYAGPNYGNNASVSEALTRGEIEANKGDFLTTLLSGGWDSASRLADSQAGRDTQVNMHNASLSTQQRLGALQSLINLGATQGADQRANIGTLLDTGGTMRGIDSDQRTAPLDLIDWGTQNLSGLGPGQFLGQRQTGTTTSKQSGGLFSQITGGLGALAMGAGGMGFKPFG